MYTLMTDHSNVLVYMLQTFKYTNRILISNKMCYVDNHIHIYIPNQAIRVAKLCFYCFFL